MTASQYSYLIASPFFIATVVAVVMVFRWWGKSNVYGSRWSILLIIETGIWLAAQGLEMVSADFNAKVFWNSAQWLGIASLPGTYLLIALDLSGWERKVRTITTITLGVVPAIVLAIVYTNPLHHFFIEDYSILHAKKFIALRENFDTGFWIFIGYSLCLLIAGIFMLIRLSAHSPGFYRHQIRWLIIGALGVGCAQALELSRWNPIPYFSFATLVLAFFILGISASFLGFKKQDLRWIAEPKLVDAMTDPVLFLDPELHLLDLNSSARILLDTDHDHAVGKPLIQVAPYIFDRISPLGQRDGKVTLEFPDGTDTYDACLSSIFDNNGRLLSRILTLSSSHDDNQLRANLLRTKQLVGALSNVAVQVAAASNPRDVLETMGKELRKLNVFSVFVSYDRDFEISSLEYISLGKGIINTLEGMVNERIHGLTIPKAKWPALVKQILDDPYPVFIADFSGSVIEFFENIGHRLHERALSLGGITRDTRGMYIPLKLSNGIAGVIAVWGDSLQEEDVLAFSVFGSQVATAFEQARLLDLAQKHTREAERASTLLHVLNQMALRTVAVQDSKEVFKILGNELSKLDLHCSFFSVDQDCTTAVIEYLSSDIKTIHMLEKIGNISAIGYRIQRNEWSQLALKAIESNEPIYIPRFIDEITIPFKKFGNNLIRRGLKLVEIDETDSAFFVPLRKMDDRIRILTLWGKSLHEKDLPAYTIFANQISNVLERVRQHERERKQERELRHSHALVKSLSDVGAFISSKSDPELIMEVMGEELKKHGIQCLVTLIDKNSQEGYIRYHSMDSRLLGAAEKLGKHKMTNQRLPLSKWPALIVSIFENGQPVYVEDFLESTACFLVDISQPVARKALSLVGVHENTHGYFLPLEVQGDIFGCLAVWGDGLDADDLPAFSVFASQVAGAFETARLYEAEREQAIELQRSNELLQALSRVAASLSSVSTLEEILETMRGELIPLEVDFSYTTADRDQNTARIQFFSSSPKILESIEKKGFLSKITRPIPESFWTNEAVHAVEENRTIFLPDFATAMRPYFHWASESIYQRGLKLFGISENTTGFFLPLVASDGSVGFLTIWGNALRESDLATFNVFRKQIESTLENQQLFHKAEQEISERRAAQKSLLESREEYRGLFENAHDAIIIFEPESGQVLDVNQRACEMYGYSQEEFNQISFYARFENEGFGRAQINNVLELGYDHNVEIVQFRKDCTKMDLEINASVVTYKGKKAIQSINRDITDRKQIEAQLQYDALHDSLTRLPNRTLFLDRLEHDIARSSRTRDYSFATLFIDLDDFKDVNDSLGHSYGDSLLVETAHRLAASLRSMDTVARFGGDEFVVLLEDIHTAHEVSTLCNRILDTIAKPFSLNGHETQVTASIGVVMGTTDCLEAEEYLRDADIALYRAKAQGRAQYEIFNTSMRNQVIERLQFESDLRQAITNQEFEIHYQPIMTLREKELKGYEALVRWRKPEGIILPGHFIPFAEETGIIHELGGWILRKACQEFVDIYQEFTASRGLILHVNVSAMQILRDDFPEEIRAIISETGMEPSHLALEITETAIINDQETAIKQLRTIRDIGVRLYLDDFGTGYSSLNFLASFPIDALKIDRQFVVNLGDKKQQDLVSAFVTLGNKLGMEIIIEGIEDQWQLELLGDLGCVVGQGFLFSKPAEINAVRRSIASLPPKISQGNREEESSDCLVN